jgi:hypothetical protein
MLLPGKKGGAADRRLGVAGKHAEANKRKAG